jgi:hypothetical protein
MTRRDYLELAAWVVLLAGVGFLWGAMRSPSLEELGGFPGTAPPYSRWSAATLRAIAGAVLGVIAWMMTRGRRR